MHKNHKNPLEKKADDFDAGSENVSKNVKYIRKLALQRSVLNMLVETKKTKPPDGNSPFLPENA